MKVKVLKVFRDKNTKKIYKAGQIIEVAKKRFEEINSTAFGVLVEEVQEGKQEPKAEPKKKSAKK